MSDVRNCRRCNKIYNYVSGPPICVACRQLDEEDFKKVKEYLNDNPGASLQQISNEMEISVEKIKRFLKEGRLEIVSSEGNMVLECESCGKAIKSGRFCVHCGREVADDFKSAADKISKSLSESANDARGIGMRHLNKTEKDY